MNIRERQETWEKEWLSPHASFSSEAERDWEEEPCDIRSAYQRDRDRILHSKSFRRLIHKTQVFLAPRGDHYRTRLTHTLEVAQIARTIARALRLNEDLTEAIAYGHDLGHTPFGHAGEFVLNEISPYGFCHYEQSIRVVELLEKNGKGLNLTKEVRDGILNHSSSRMPSTLEGKVVRLSDKIAYINHDIDDAIRGHIIVEDEIPGQFTEVLGHSSRERLNKLVHNIIINSLDKDDIVMAPEVMEAMMGIRKYMFDTVYTNPKAKGQESKAMNLLKVLYDYYSGQVKALPKEYQRYIYEAGRPKEQVVCDYIAGMTDQFAIDTYEDLYVPIAWKVF